MQLEVDQEADALYFRLDDSQLIDSEEVSSGIIIDYNENDEVAGIEILNLSNRTSIPNLKELKFKSA